MVTFAHGIFNFSNFKFDYSHVHGLGFYSDYSTSPETCYGMYRLGGKYKCGIGDNALYKVIICCNSHYAIGLIITLFSC